MLGPFFCKDKSRHNRISGINVGNYNVIGKADSTIEISYLLRFLRS